MINNSFNYKTETHLHTSETSPCSHISASEIVKRYAEQDTWKENLIFGKSSFDLLQDILESAGELSVRAPYEHLVTTTFAENAVVGN